MAVLFIQMFAASAGSRRHKGKSKRTIVESLGLLKSGNGHKRLGVTGFISNSVFVSYKAVVWVFLLFFFYVKSSSAKLLVTKAVRKM